MANGGKDNGRFRTATLVNWHLLPEVELTPGGFAQMQPAPWPEGIDTMVRFKDALSCEFREAQGLHFYSDDYQFERVWTKPEVYLELLQQFAFVVEPDFSMYLDFPEPLQKWNHYRNQLLGAWWQARGLHDFKADFFQERVRLFDFCAFQSSILDSIPQRNHA